MLLLLLLLLASAGSALGSAPVYLLHGAIAGVVPATLDLALYSEARALVPRRRLPLGAGGVFALSFDPGLVTALPLPHCTTADAAASSASAAGGGGISRGVDIGAGGASGGAGGGGEAPAEVLGARGRVTAVATIVDTQGTAYIIVQPLVVCADAGGTRDSSWRALAPARGRAAAAVTAAAPPRALGAQSLQLAVSPSTPTLIYRKGAAGATLPATAGWCSSNRTAYEASLLAAAPRPLFGSAAVASSALLLLLTAAVGLVAAAWPRPARARVCFDLPCDASGGATAASQDTVSTAAPTARHHVLQQLRVLREAHAKLQQCGGPAPPPPSSSTRVRSAAEMRARVLQVGALLEQRLAAARSMLAPAVI